MGNKRRIILTVIIAGVLLISVVGSYAFFTSTADNSNKLTGTIETGTMALTFDDGNTNINERLMFGESVTKKFIITNTGSLEASLSLDWKDLINTYLDGSLTYNLSYSTEENGTYTEIIPETNMPVTEEKLTQTLASELSVPAGDTYYYNLTITLNNTDFDQTDDADAIFNTKFAVNDPVKYRYYKLTVDPNGGSLGKINTPQEYLLQNNDTMSITSTPTRVGHTFLGWKLTGLSSNYNSGTFTMGIGDTKLIAQWDVNKYNVTLNLDGGSYEGSTDLEVEYGSTIELSTPTKEGHTFAGWSTEVGSLDGNNFTLDRDADAVVTANWTVESFPYKVIHKQMNVSGSGYTEVDTETGTLAYGTKLDAEVKTYEGFTSPTQKSITIGVGENTVTYEYDRIEYTLSINPDGGSYSGNTSVKLLYGASTTISDPTKAGHTFAGWEVPSGTLAGTNYTMGAGDATLKAKWVANTYKYIVYHKQQQFDETTYTVKDTTPGEGAYGTVVKPDTKTYTGFTAPAKTSLTIGEDNDPPTKNIVNYQYKRVKPTLTIDAAGGSYSGTNPGTMYYGASITLGTPTKTGYKFNGWTKTAGSDSTLSGSTFTMGSSAATVKATWEVLSYSYTVKHSKMNTDGKTYTLVSGDTQNLSANYGTSVTGTPKTNYGAGFGAGTCTSVTIGTDTTKNVVECKYPRNKFSITIKPNGGSYNGSTSNTTISNVYYGSTKTLATPTKTGYSYKWGVSGTGSSVSGSTFTMGTANAVVTANWTANTYTVNFNANGGSVTQGSKTVTYASTYGTLPTPTYTGYKFLGWYTAKTGGTKIVSSTNVAITSTQTLYAHWEKAVGTSVTLTKLGVTPKTGNPTFASAATTDEGVYSLPDDYGTSYYYRGAVTNNYVKFANKYWRIIRVNGDGSLRMIYDGTVPHKNGGGASTFTTTGVDGTTLSADRFINNGATTVFNSSYKDNAYVGWMYGTTGGTKEQAQTNTNNSSLKGLLNTWYDDNLASYNQYIADAVYCADRSVPGKSASGWSEDTGLGYGRQVTAYGATARTAVWNSTTQPQFTCPNKNDAFTVSDSEHGNAIGTAKSRKIGLITADEIVAAGSGKFNTTNRNYYLYKASNYWYWSLSPIYYYSNAVVFYVDTDGSLDNYYVNSADGAVAPVISLKAEYAAQLMGSGTASSPYYLSGVN